MASSTHHRKKWSLHCRPFPWDEEESVTIQLLVFCLQIMYEPTGNGTSLKAAWGLSSVTTEIVIFTELVNLVELEHTSQIFYFGFKTNGGIEMGLGHCFTVTISWNRTPKSDRALSHQLLILIPCCSLPPIILGVWDVIGNQIGMLIWVKTNLSLLREKNLYWFSIQFSLWPWKHLC